MIHDPIKMVLLSLIGVLFFCLFYIFVSKVLKKKLSYLTLLIVISLLPLLSLLRVGTYESGDLSLHSKFAISFFESIREGNFIPVWDKYMVGGFGYPYFQFIYPLPYYIAFIINLFGFSIINSFKILAALSFTLSGLAMYFFVKEETKKSLAGFIAAIFYLFAPYHLIDLHFRFAIGEILAFLFLPLTFYFIRKINRNNYLLLLVFLSFCLTGLILAHQAIALVSILFLILYIIYIYLKEKNSKLFLVRILSFIGGIGLSAFFWFPALAESIYTYNLNREILFHPLKYYFYSPSRYGLLYQGTYGELYFPMGYVQLIIFILTLFIFLIPKFRKRYFSNEKLLIAYLIISFLISFFMLISISKPIWELIPILSGFQFSFRFSLLTTFFLSIIAGIVLVKIKHKQLIYIILSSVVLITILNWGNRRVIPEINDTVLKQNMLSEQIPVGQGTTIWANADQLMVKKRHGNLELVSGKAKFNEKFRSSTKHEYAIEIISQEGAKFIENTLFFPGWHLIINGKDEEVSDNTRTKNGLMTFNLPKGEYVVIFEFKLTDYKKTGRIISFLSIILLLIPIYKYQKLKK